MRTRIVAMGILITGLLLPGPVAFSQDANFHIYLCFGQSNMEGQGKIDQIDRVVDSRFQVMAAVECTNTGRAKGNWYPAVPPLARCWTGLSPADYFGKMMILNLPDSIRVGVINVSVAGCKIELFEKDTYQDYVSSVTEGWLLNIINAYNGNPYAYLVDLAKQAQEEGVIKGILLHQGESNTGDASWPSKVKGIYENLIADLVLEPDSIPLLAGEVVHADQGGICASMNSIIATLPDSLPNSFVISSSGCTDTTDNLHFNSAGYRELGLRYGVQMLSLLGYDTTSLKYPEVPGIAEGTEAVYFEAECATVGEDWEISNDASASNEKYVSVKPGTESISAPPADSAGVIYFPFRTDTSGNFNIYARLNCPTYDDDSFWLKMDDGSFVISNGLVTSGWQWIKLNNYTLSKGEHVLGIAYRENGALLDKVCISNYANAPAELGDSAFNCRILAKVLPETADRVSGYSLHQNFPNPFFGITNINFCIPEDSFVSVKVYGMPGNELAELAGKSYETGDHCLEFNSGELSEGYYFYIMKTKGFVAARKMVIMAR